MSDTTITPSAVGLAVTGTSAVEGWRVPGTAGALAITGAIPVPGYNRTGTAGSTTLTGITPVITGITQRPPVIPGVLPSGGAGANIANGATVTICGWQLLADRTPMRVVVRVVATDAFRVNLITTPDGGTTTIVAKQVASAAVNVDGGTAGYDNVAELDAPLPYLSKIEIFNSSGTTINAAWEYRKYSVAG